MPVPFPVELDLLFEKNPALAVRMRESCTSKNPSWRAFDPTWREHCKYEEGPAPPIELDRDYRIRDGHGRASAARR